MPSLTVPDAQINPAFRHPIDASDKKRLAARYRDLFPATVDAELAEARRLAAHQFTFLSQTMAHGDRIAWSRDPISGRDWPRAFSRDIVYRGPDRLGDIKLPWELSKHQYFFTLGKAAWLSGDAAPAVEIMKQIDHWIDDNPADTGIHWISALEAGTRATSWIMAYPFYAESGDRHFHSRLIASIARHLLFVEQHLSTGAFANTHLVGEAAALVVGGLFVKCRDSARWVATGLQVLDKEIERQLTADAGHVERSVAYHRFFLDQYYLVAALLAANGRSLSTPTLQSMERATAYLMNMLFADGTAPAFGDADDARGLWFRADAPTDYRGLLALGSVLFGRLDFKSASASETEDVFWLFGSKGIAAFDALDASSHRAASIAFPDAGYYVLRGGCPIDGDPTLVFDCGPLGFGSAGHGHADALSFQLHVGGYSFFVDPGTFSYNLDYAWRDAFRGTRAHNTLVVDGQDQSVPGDRMSWKTAARSKALGWVTTRWFDLVDGAHDGYRRLSDPVSHRRVICFLKPDVWVIWDNVTASDYHEIEMLLHLRPDCRVDATPGGKMVVLTGPDGQQLTAWLGTESSSEPFRVIGDADTDRISFSPTYATRCPSRALSVRRQVVGRTDLLTCLTSTTTQRRPVVTREDDAITIRVQQSGDEQTLFYSADGPATYRSARMRFDGGVLFERTQVDALPVVWADRVRELVVDGLVEVSSTASFNRIVVNGNPGEVEVYTDEPGRLSIRAPEGLKVVVNGLS
jgi:uncharacterized heparinase superfamily protein